MKIAVVTTSFLPNVGGAEHAVHHLATCWGRAGHRVTVVHGAGADAPTSPDYATSRYRIPRGAHRLGPHRAPFAALAARRIGSRIRACAPERIAVHFGYPTALWMERLPLSVPYTVTCHGPALNETPSGPRQRYGLDRRLVIALDRARSVVAISSDARRILESIGVSKDKIVDIPNGVDLDRFRTGDPDFDLRARFGLPRGARIVLSVGRDSWAKDYGTALRAFRRAGELHPEARYVVLGKGTARLREPARELGIDDRVVLCEGLFGDELVSAYRQSDVFLLSSIKELCPLVVPEAMAAGLAMVVTNVSGAQDMVVSGINGTVVAPGNEVEIASALAALLADDERRHRFGSESLRLAEAYDWERIARRHLESM